KTVIMITESKTTRIKLAPQLARFEDRFGKRAIEIRITKYKYVTAANIGEYISEDIWDPVNRRVYYRHPQTGKPVQFAKEINQLIEKKLTLTENFIRRYFLKHDQEPHPKQIVQFIRGSYSNNNDDFELISWSRKYINERW